MQNDLRMAKEKARRKQAIIGRQEEELAAREASLDSMRKEQAGSSRQVDHLQEDNKALKVRLLINSSAFCTCPDIAGGTGHQELH